MKTLKLLFLIYLLLFSVNWAQTFEASTEKSVVAQNERFEVSFTFEGGDSQSLKDFRQPDFGGLTILSGPNRSSSIQIINGNMSSSLTYSFILVAKKMGEYQISESSINYKGQVLRTKKLKIKVSKESKSESSSSGITDEDISKNLFIRAIPSKTNVYKGEEIVVVYKLYTRLSISSPQVSKFPKYPDFWTEELDMPSTLALNYEMYNGERFQVATIKKVSLFPTKSGKLTITPFKLKIPVIVQKRQTRRNNSFDDFFNDPFFNRTERIEREVASNSIMINSKELPAGQPSSFSGAVGNFDFSANLVKNEVEANEPIAINLSLSGSGNIVLAEMPKLQIPDGFEVYDPKTTENISKRDRISGKKTAEYLLISRSSGERIIDAIQFSYFNPASGKYITKTFGPFKIHIKKGSGNFPQNGLSNYTKEEIQLLDKDLRFIKTQTDFERIEPINLLPTFFIIWNLLSILGFIAIVIYKLKEEAQLENIDLINFKKADKAARKRLETAKKSLQNNNYTEFLAHLSESIYEYLEIKLKMPKSDFSISKVEDKLRNMNFTEEVIVEFRRIIENAEFMRFAISQQNYDEMNKLYENSVKLILDLDAQFRKDTK